MESIRKEINFYEKCSEMTIALREFTNAIIKAQEGLKNLVVLWNNINQQEK